MSNFTMLNDIALLPKSIEYCEETFMFNTWITFKWLKNHDSKL